MSFIDSKTGELNVKIVYYGPGLAGKTTNIQYVFNHCPRRGVREEDRDKFISLATETDRTLIFNFMPRGLPLIDGHPVRLHLYTVPGPVFYDRSRSLVLKGVEAVVFVADSQELRIEACVRSIMEMESNLSLHGHELADFPLVIQYNKRDLPTARPLAELEALLNPAGRPSFEAVAYKGIGVFATLQSAWEQVLRKHGVEPPSGKELRGTIWDTASFQQTQLPEWQGPSAKQETARDSVFHPPPTERPTLWRRLLNRLGRKGGG